MDLRTFQCWQKLTAYLGFKQKVGSPLKAIKLPQPTPLLPISNEKPLRADAVERSGEQDKSETRQESLGLEHSTVKQEMSQTSLSGPNTPHTKEDMISIDNLTALLRDSGLNLTASVDQVYCPKNEPSLVDIMLIDGPEIIISPDADTPTLYREELRDVLKRSHSKVRLITCTSNIDMKDSFRETASERSLLNSRPSALKLDSHATYRACDQTDISCSRHSRQEYIIRSISDHVSNTATTDINSERPLTVIYHSKGIGAVAKRAMIEPIKPSEISQLPASYSLRWLDPEWRTIESIISDLRITKNLIPCSLDSVQVKESAELRCPVVCSNFLSGGSHLISHPFPEIELPERRTAAHLDGIATGQPTLDRYEPSIQIDKAVAHARRRNRNMFIEVFEKPVDAVKSLWLDLSLSDRIQE